MRTPRLFFVLLVSLALTACAGSQPQPAQQAAANPNQGCTGSDHGLSEQELGWQFCYPASWRFIEKLQGSDAPTGVDTTFDITDTASGGGNGLFGFMIVGTYERGSQATLRQWLAANYAAYRGSSKLETIQWGNALDAAVDPASGKRFALTEHHVVVLELKAGQGNLDLNTAMTGRLSSWKFAY